MSRALTAEGTLAERFKNETSEAHRQVEKHPFVLELIREELTPVQYFSHLVDLHLVYSTMEHALRSSLTKEPRLKPLLFKGLERASALEKDMHSTAFSGFVHSPSQQAKAYAAHLKSLADYSPLLIIAHMYVRYIGDLSGGMMIKRHIASQWPDAVHFYDFDGLLKESGMKNPVAFKDMFKEHLNALVLSPKEQSELVKETNQAFTLSGRLFDAIINHG